MTTEVYLTEEEQDLLSGAQGNAGDQMAISIVVEAARILGADRLVPIGSAHIDGCLYHGSSGTLFCEKLVDLGAKVSVPATTNVGALNLLNPAQSRLSGEARKMAYRLMVAHEKMGCRPSWTCAPYQAGARPALGQQVAWGESNAVAFCNSVLGARTNRYGDFLDIACAISGRVPYYGLHVAEHRFGTMVFDVSGLRESLQSNELFFPVLGAVVGRKTGSDIPVIVGLNPDVGEDTLKSLCASAAATGAVGLIHLVGITPEAPDLSTALGGVQARQTVIVTKDVLAQACAQLSLAETDSLDAVALGSPHFSADECRMLLAKAQNKPFKCPLYVCIGRHTLKDLKSDDAHDALLGLGAQFVVDTCVVVTPILPETTGTLMTNSAKFAHYAKGNTGYLPIFGSLDDCVSSAQSGRVVRRHEGWL